jgi:hypothetical protein
MGGEDMCVQEQVVVFVPPPHHHMCKWVTIPINGYHTRKWFIPYTIPVNGYPSLHTPLQVYIPHHTMLPSTYFTKKDVLPYLPSSVAAIEILQYDLS